MNAWDEMGDAGDVTTPPQQITVARAVQKLAARSVRRAGLPLGALVLAGVLEGARYGFSRPAVILVLGAVASGLVMLSYGVQAVRRAEKSGRIASNAQVSTHFPQLVQLALTLRRVGLSKLAQESRAPLGQK